QSELDLRNSALDATGSHFVIADSRRPKGPIVYVNRAVARDCGYAPEEMLGMTLKNFFPPELNEAQFELLRDAVRTGSDLRTELQARRRDGSTFWVGMFMTFLRDAHGKITHTVSTGADITRRLEQESAQRRLQEQLLSEMQERERMAIELRLAQKLESVGRLAAGIAHEINTPIQYIGDSLHFLQSATSDLLRLLTHYQAAIPRLADRTSNVPPILELGDLEAATDLPFLTVEIPKAFERTLLGVEHVASIVRAMKEFAHPDATEHSAADINHAVETTLVVARNEYKYSAEIQTNLALLPEVICNVGELNQVFLNLIVNAAQAIRESGQDAATGRITITSERCGDQVIVSIADNGCGISQENVEKVFDPFFTTKPVGLGTGQGLAIARSIVVEKHGGAIDVQSALGTGTRFTVRLPISGRTPTEAA
ncbi:MAG: putative sensor signal transduction histidine kinase, partial [Gammaproteobacteria bacterium]|nr:putative sensor signal transduction histidine kinase [Gammaproteobacteria bacterium]